MNDIEAAKQLGWLMIFVTELIFHIFQLRTGWHNKIQQILRVEL